MTLDRRPAQYDPEASHACDLLHAGTVRVLDRTRWHDPAGPSLAGLVFSSSEALYEASCSYHHKDSQRSVHRALSGNVNANIGSHQSSRPPSA